MAFLAQIIRWLVWLVVAAWLGRKVFRAFTANTPKEVRPGSPLVPRPLYRDPWCGTHVSAEISYPLKQAGQVVHFCSAECREHFQASQRQAASG